MWGGGGRGPECPGLQLSEVSREGGSGHSVCAWRSGLGAARASSMAWEDHGRLLPARFAGVTCPSDSCRVWGQRRHPLESTAGGLVVGEAGVSRP